MKNRCIICGEEISDRYSFCRECYDVNEIFCAQVHNIEDNQIVDYAKMVLNVLSFDDVYENCIELKILLLNLVRRLDNLFENANLFNTLWKTLKIYNEDYVQGEELLEEFIDNLEESLTIEKEGYKFYKPDKKYSKREPILNDREQEFYEFVKKKLKKRYTITPQVNLQTIISTITNTRNDELFRNVDFCIYKTKGYVPLLVIELNGEQHYYNDYNKRRDESVKNILDDCDIPLITYRNKDLEINDNILKDIYNTIKHNKKQKD